MFRILRGRKRGEMKWQKKKSNFFLFIGKSKGWSDRKSGMQNGLSDIVNEWWCLWKQQHSHKGHSELGIIYFISYASSLTFFTSIISLFTLHFKSYLFLFPFAWVGILFILKWFSFCQNKAVIYYDSCKWCCIVYVSIKRLMWSKSCLDIDLWVKLFIMCKKKMKQKVHIGNKHDFIKHKNECCIKISNKFPVSFCLQI